jgi:hypothetical protein
MLPMTDGPRKAKGNFRVAYPEALDIILGTSATQMTVDGKSIQFHTRNTACLLNPPMHRIQSVGTAWHQTVQTASRSCQCQVYPPPRGSSRPGMMRGRSQARSSETVPTKRGFVGVNEFVLTVGHDVVDIYLGMFYLHPIKTYNLKHTSPTAHRLMLQTAP